VLAALAPVPATFKNHLTTVPSHTVFTSAMDQGPKPQSSLACVAVVAILRGLRERRKHGFQPVWSLESGAMIELEGKEVS
jgi:hypothetical protein